MRSTRLVLPMIWVFTCVISGRADFKYTETSQVTGGALVGMVKFASVFARGDAKKQEREALAPTSTTHYVKGGRLRTDNADGTAQIIDLDNRRVIFIDSKTMTYAVATFDQIKAAAEQALQEAQTQMQQQNPQEARQLQNTQLTITPTIAVKPGSGTRLILDQPTNETEVQIDMVMEASSTDPSAQSAAASSGQSASGSATYSMKMDTFVAPSVAGYGEFAEFYRRAAKEVSWMTLPSNIHVDPRVSQGLSQLQENSDALKGFPMLSYVSMALAPAPGSAQNNGKQQQAPNNPPPSTSESTSSIPDTPSGMVMKGLGGLFKKKQQQKAESTEANAPAANPNHDPNALIEITTQVNSFSASSLDSSLFDLPAGYTQVQADPMQIMNGTRTAPGQK